MIGEAYGPSLNIMIAYRENGLKKASGIDYIQMST